MNRVKRLKLLLLAPMMVVVAISYSFQAHANIGVVNGLTFFEDGTQIIKNEVVTLIRFNNGDIHSDEKAILNYFNDPDRAEVAKSISSDFGFSVDFNRVNITRDNIGISDFDGSEVTIIYTNTGLPIESYDSRGEVRKFTYNKNGKIIRVDSNRFGTKVINHEKG